MLEQFQQQFKNNLLAPETDQAFLAQINEISDQQAAQRLSIYRNNVMNSLTEVLADIYPTVKRLVGDDFFQQLARACVRTHPPQTAVVAHYGEMFPEFIADILQQQAIDNLDYLPDVAQLEWLQQCSYYAADENQLDVQALTQVQADDLDNLVFQALPAVYLMRSHWPVVAIWQENLKAEPQPIDLTQTQHDHVLICRREFAVEVISLAPECYDFLEQLFDSATLSQAMMKIAERYNCTDQALSEMLAWLLGLPIFSTYSVAS